MLQHCQYPDGAPITNGGLGPGITKGASLGPGPDHPDHPDPLGNLSLKVTRSCGSGRPYLKTGLMT